MKRTPRIGIAPRQWLGPLGGRVLVVPCSVSNRRSSRVVPSALFVGARWWLRRTISKARQLGRDPRLQMSSAHGHGLGLIKGDRLSPSSSAISSTGFISSATASAASPPICRERPSGWVGSAPLLRFHRAARPASSGDGRLLVDGGLVNPVLCRWPGRCWGRHRHRRGSHSDVVGAAWRKLARTRTQHRKRKRPAVGRAPAVALLAHNIPPTDEPEESRYMLTVMQSSISIMSVRIARM